MSGADVREREILADTPDGPMVCHVFSPSGDGPYPVVVLLHDITGVRDELKGMARRHAERAEVMVVVPELYHRLGDGVTFDRGQVFAPGNEELRAAMFRAFKSVTDERMVTDAHAAAQAARTVPSASPGPIGVIGYCLGGRGALRFLAAYPGEVAAGSLIHPSELVSGDADSPHLDIPRIRAEVYLDCGAADDQATPEIVAALRAQLDGAGVEYTMDLVEGADHGFAFASNPERYHPVADERHWERTTDLFRRRLAP